jgi:hypothetical protein
LNERWDGDRTGAGVSDGEPFVPPIRGLLEEMARPDWNTEQPEAHLFPHLERWCGREDSPFALRSAAVEGTVFVVDLQRTATVPVADARADVYALVATIAEPTTVVVQSEADDVIVFDVTLAVTPGQSMFPKGHGHLVRLRLHAT